MYQDLLLDLEELKEGLFAGGSKDLLWDERECKYCKKENTHIVCIESDWNKCSLEWNSLVSSQESPKKCMLTYAKDEAGEWRFMLIENDFVFFFFDMIRFAESIKENWPSLVNNSRYYLPEEVRTFLEHEKTIIFCTSELEIVEKLYPKAINKYLLVHD